MRHDVHTGLRRNERRHLCRNSIVDDGDVGDDVGTDQGIFDVFFSVGDNGKRRDFGRSAGRRRDADQFCFCPQLRKFECDQIVEIIAGIFVIHPHDFGCIHRRSAAQCNDPVGIEFGHLRSAVFTGFNGRIGFDAVYDCYLHSRFFQIAFRFIDESEFFHRASAGDNHRFFPFQCGKELQCTCTVDDPVGDAERCVLHITSIKTFAGSFNFRKSF